MTVPNIKSVKKDVIKSRKNHLRNISAKSAMKTFIKKARTLVDAHAADAAPTNEAVRLACKAIDKTAERGIIHKNQASRRKSRLMKHANKMAQAAA
jgi:small subunit ribosomal protein S20